MITSMYRQIMTKSWMYFDIMHKDRRVARIYRDGHATISFSSFMPYNLYLEKGDDIDTKLNNLENFYYWCSSRVLSLDRKYAKEILNYIGAKQSVTDKERSAIALSYHCLNLMDVYWVRGTDEKRTFSQLSLYRHPLSDAFVDVSLRGKGLTTQNSELLTSQDKAPDVGTPGLAPKAWVREGNDFYLLKDGDERDVKAEILASEVVSCFKVDYVRYEAFMFKGSPVARCKIVTTESRGLLSREYIEVYCQNHNKNGEAYVLEKDPYSFYMMNIVDYLIGNTDRHWGNWGFYVDGDTNKILKLYPLMDFNKAFSNYVGIEGANCLTYISDQRISQKEAALIAVKAIGLNQVKPIDESIFPSDEIKNVFLKRLHVLKQAIQEQ